MNKGLLAALLLAVTIGTVGVASTASANDGAGIYKARCIACHGAAGKGTAMAPGFAGSEYITSSTEADITGVILNGRNGAAKKYKKFALGMPPIKLGEADMKALVAHLKALAAK
ncbi:MAG: cytochrome c [Proteobacteria bacterium]|nr:cytochrome c [Pseudomonadota bacterium]